MRRSICRWFFRKWGVGNNFSHPSVYFFVCMMLMILTLTNCIQLFNFSSIFGVLFGLIVVAIQNSQLFEESSKYYNRSHIGPTVFSILSLIAYTIFACFCTSKYICNEILPYIVFLPVCSFIIIHLILIHMWLDY